MDPAKAKVEVFDRIWGNVPDGHSRDRSRGQIRTPLGSASRVHCVNCGKLAGYTFGDTSKFFYLCDDGCDRYGSGLELGLVDEDLVRALAGG